MDFTVSGKGMTFFFFICRTYSYSAMIAGVILSEEDTFGGYCNIIAAAPLFGDFLITFGFIFFLRYGGSMKSS